MPTCYLRLDTSGGGVTLIYVIRVHHERHGGLDDDHAGSRRVALEVAPNAGRLVLHKLLHRAKRGVAQPAVV